MTSDKPTAAKGGGVSAGLSFTPADPPDKAFWAKCRVCAHCWPAAYYPIDMRTLAKITKRTPCPKCGDLKPVVAKQDNGVLLETEQA